MDKQIIQIRADEAICNIRPVSALSRDPTFLRLSHAEHIAIAARDAEDDDVRETSSENFVPVDEPVEKVGVVGDAESV